MVQGRGGGEGERWWCRGVVVMQGRGDGAGHFRDELSEEKPHHVSFWIGWNIGESFVLDGEIQ